MALRFKRPTSPVGWILVGLLALALITFVVWLPLPGGNPRGTTSASDIPKRPSPGAVNPQPDDDATKLRQFLLDYKSGYDCAVNQNAKRVQDLQMCPDYTTVVNLTTNPPQVTRPIATNGHYPVDLTVKPVRNCGNDGVQGAPVTCSNMVKVQWTVDTTRFIVLGYNQQSAHAMRADGSDWSGPIGLGTNKGDMLVDPAQTRVIEIYASDPHSPMMTVPLTHDRQAPKN